MKRLLLFVLGSMVLWSCETEGFQEPENNSPVFEFISEINDVPLTIQAGLNGVENKPSFQMQNGQFNYLSSFSIPASSGTPYRKLNLHLKQFPKVISTAEAQVELFNDELDFILSFTGTEGFALTPVTDGIVDPYVTAWTIDGKPITTQTNPLVPLPILRESDFVDIRYSLRISNKFHGIMNSALNLNPDLNCNGSLDIDLMQDHAILSFTGDNELLDQYEWNTGETTSSIAINLEAQSLVLDVSSPDCKMNVQLNIDDPSALPDALSYNFEYVEGPASNLPFHGFVIELIDETGEIFRSDYGLQNEASVLNITDVESFGLDLEGNPALKVNGTLEAVLYNLDQNKVVHLTDAQMSFAISHPAN